MDHDGPFGHSIFVLVEPRRRPQSSRGDRSVENGSVEGGSVEGDDEEFFSAEEEEHEDAQPSSWKAGGGHVGHADKARWRKVMLGVEIVETTGAAAFCLARR